MIVARGSEFPNTVSTLRNIPGIGDYTAGTIASIAFKEVIWFCKFFFFLNNTSGIFLISGISGGACS